jgi:Ca2+-binding EF-hand superfamily protein
MNSIKESIMVASISSNSSAVSNWADSVYSKLDTKNQGYIEKTDLQDALSKASANGSGTASRATSTTPSAPSTATATARSPRAN